MAARQIIKARHGKAARMKAGQRLTLVNVHGHQVVDTWALCDPDLDELLSMEHSRASVGSVYIREGDTLVSNRNRPMLTFEEDATDGGHDTLVAACSPGLYEKYGIQCPPHRACALNLVEAMRELALELPEQPAPWNLFQHSYVEPDGSIRHEEPHSEPGCHVVLRAECDLIIAFSCCPWDVGVLINGPDGEINDCEFEIGDSPPPGPTG